MEFYSDLINKAAEFAAIAHGRQLRKSPEAQIPYFQHPLMVGLILQRAGLDDQVVAAGILHDVLEDTKAKSEDLERGFGSRIARIVLAVSERNKSLPWEERKERYLEGLRGAGSDVRAVAAADKIHNIRSILLSLERGVDIWARFKRGREVQVDRFRRVLKVLGSGWDHPLLAELERSVLELENTSA
jgi:(p)ppGpp synthase/HD superfamily hydrolase